MCQSDNTPPCWRKKTYMFQQKQLVEFSFDSELELQKSAHKPHGANMNLQGPLSKPPGPEQMSHPGTEESLVWSSVVRSGTDWAERKKVQVTRVMILSAFGKWCAGLSWICPFSSHPIIHAWVVDPDPRGYVQRDALEEMRSLEQIVWSKWSKPCRSNSFASAFDLLFLSTGAQFLWWEMTSLIYILVVFERLRLPWTRTPPEVSCSNKAPTHMSILRYSEVWWARSHHPQSCPASKQQAQRRGMAGRKEEQVRFICSLFFFY